MGSWSRAEADGRSCVRQRARGTSLAAPIEKGEMLFW